MSLIGLNQLGKSIEDEGKFHYQYFYKPACPSHSTAGYFVDCNQSSGQPKYNPFAGSELTATQLFGSGNAGIYVGNFISGKTKHLLRAQLYQANTSINPSPAYLNDYLLFYPLIDCDNVDPQDMTNVNALPRYTNGEGVRIVLIVTAPVTSTSSLTITYTNSDGVSGRTATANIIPGAAIGVCATAGGGTAGTGSQASPFWPLASGDKGVRLIESVQFASGAGGFICAALVKPIASIPIYEPSVPIEVNFGFERVIPPEIKEGAYLNLIYQAVATTAFVGNFRGEFIFINS
jgi:hypothetical protein